VIAMRVVEATGLRLEPQVEAHAAEMFRVLSDPAIYEYENAPPESQEWLRARFARLESRQSGDGSELWLNWVVRLPDGDLAGYVQATVRPGEAAIAYELASAFWGRGLGQQAVRAMIAELAQGYEVRNLCAVLKRTNLRSRRMLDRLGFVLASPESHASRVEADEWLMERGI
jgi:RimJ/RimL family protein N-acetyltransferase